jgi:hypothetical protein
MTYTSITKKTMRVLPAFFTALALTTGMSMAEEKTMPEFPKPTSEHQWLQQLVGEWESQIETIMEPGKPGEKTTGTESVKPVGPFWTVSEISGTMMNQPFAGNMTIGYDADKKKYVGTWIDSMTGKLWNYEGSVDPSGKTLTLESEGECPMRPGKVTKFRDVTTLKDKNHKEFSSAMMDDNGEWVTMMTGQSTRRY